MDANESLGRFDQALGVQKRCHLPDEGVIAGLRRAAVLDDVAVCLRTASVRACTWFRRARRPLRRGRRHVAAEERPKGATSSGHETSRSPHWRRACTPASVRAVKLSALGSGAERLEQRACSAPPAVAIPGWGWTRESVAGVTEAKEQLHTLVDMACHRPRAQVTHTA